MPFISNDFINNRLLPAIDIVNLINHYVPLKKESSGYTCCCPFHQEKTPSFKVRPAQQFFKCFGCGAAGNAIDFVMKYKNLTYPEAIEEIANFLGIKVEYEQNAQYQHKQEQNKIYYDLMDRVATYFSDCLAKEPKALKYFKEVRQLSDNTLKEGRLGYAPDNSDYLLKEVVKSKEEIQKLIDLGLLQKKDNGQGYFASFRDRVMFPIYDLKGRVIAFGGRTLDPDKKPKYKNSSENPIFHKSNVLFGLYECLKKHANRPEQIILVEGYMDVISLRERGIDNVVAALGTATNSEHFKLMYRFTDKVICCFDSDNAGFKASWSALKVAAGEIKGTKELRFLSLPTSYDPDSLVREKGKGAFEDLLKQTISFPEFLLFYVVHSEHLNMGDANGRMVFINRILACCKAMENEVQNAVIIELLSKYVNLPSERLYSMMNSDAITPDQDFLAHNVEYKNKLKGWGNTSRDYQANNYRNIRSRANYEQEQGYVNRPMNDDNHVSWSQEYKDQSSKTQRYGNQWRSNRYQNSNNYQIDNQPYYASDSYQDNENVRYKVSQGQGQSQASRPNFNHSVNQSFNQNQYQGQRPEFAQGQNQGFNQNQYHGQRPEFAQGQNQGFTQNQYHGQRPEFAQGQNQGFTQNQYHGQRPEFAQGQNQGFTQNQYHGQRPEFAQGQNQGFTQNQYQGQRPEFAQGQNQSFTQNQYQGQRPEFAQGQNQGFTQNQYHGQRPEFAQGQNQGFNQNQYQGQRPEFAQGQNQGITQNQYQGQRPEFAQGINQGFNQNQYQGQRLEFVQGINQGFNQNQYQGQNQDFNQDQFLQQNVVNVGQDLQNNKFLQQNVTNNGRGVPQGQVPTSMGISQEQFMAQPNFVQNQQVSSPSAKNFYPEQTNHMVLDHRENAISPSNFDSLTKDFVSLNNDQGAINNPNVNEYLAKNVVNDLSQSGNEGVLPSLIKHPDVNIFELSSAEFYKAFNKFRNDPSNLSLEQNQANIDNVKVFGSLEFPNVFQHPIEATPIPADFVFLDENSDWETQNLFNAAEAFLNAPFDNRFNKGLATGKIDLNTLHAVAFKESLEQRADTPAGKLMQQFAQNQDEFEQDDVTLGYGGEVYNSDNNINAQISTDGIAIDPTHLDPKMVDNIKLNFFKQKLANRAASYIKQNESALFKRHCRYELDNYFTIVLKGENFKTRDINPPVYECIAFILQEPQVVSRFFDRFLIHDFLGMARVLRMHEYPVFLRLFTLIKLNPNISSGLILEMFRDSAFEPLFCYLLDVNFIRKGENGEELSIAYRAQMFVRLLLKCIQFSFTKKFGYLVSSVLEEEQSRYLDKQVNIKQAFTQMV